MKNSIVGLKELRENIDKYISQVAKGESFTVMRKSKPVFIMTPLGDDSDDAWEPVIDFTKIKNGGVGIADILSRI